MSNVDYAITLVRSEAQATALDNHDLTYVYKQLRTTKRVLTRGEREFPNHVNKPSAESADRCFEEVPVQKGRDTLTKLVYYSAKQAAEVCREERDFAQILWVKIAPVEEFGS